MKKNILSALVIAVSALIVYSFFLPWAKVSVSALGISKTLTKQADTTLKDTPFAGKVVGKLQDVTATLSAFGDIDVKTQVTGYGIPVLVNKKTSKVAIALAQIMFKSAENLDAKSYLVYLLPVCGILCGIASMLGRKNKVYIVGMIVVSGAISLMGLYNLHTADLSSVAVKVDIVSGLWLTMYGFLAIFLAGIAWLFIVASDKP